MQLQRTQGARRTDLGSKVLGWYPRLAGQSWEPRRDPLHASSKPLGERQVHFILNHGFTYEVVRIFSLRCRQIEDVFSSGHDDSAQPSQLMAHCRP